MKTVLLFIFGCFLDQIAADITLNNKTFADEFLFGCATAAYQIEGAWDEDGKGENNWDRFIHSDPTRIKNNATGDVACDSYHKYKDDIKLLVALGVNHYRFSISWSRILPTGLINDVNTAGLAYYKNLIKELKDNNIEPLVTLFHFDTPQPLEDMGGWPNADSIKWFADYAKLCFELFGEDVKYWMTFNEPIATCSYGYGIGLTAPGVVSPGIGEYYCIHNVVRAHAAVWHIYNDQFRAKQQGKVGIVLNGVWFQPANATNQDDVDAAERQMQFMFGIFASPLFFGDYPDVVKENVERRSLAQGFTKSRLPEFTEEEKIRLAGTVDILGVNVYTSSLVTTLTKENPDGKGINEDAEAYSYQPDNWDFGVDSWLAVVPPSGGEVVKWISQKYNNPDMIITENGFSDAGGLNDTARISFIQQYLSYIKDAMDVHGVNVKGYTVWSLLDNFEWNSGYSSKFGLYEVDFESENKTRTAKGSATFYKNLIKTRCLVDECTN